MLVLFVLILFETSFCLLVLSKLYCVRFRIDDTKLKKLKKITRLLPFSWRHNGAVLMAPRMMVACFTQTVLVESGPNLLWGMFLAMPEAAISADGQTLPAEYPILNPLCHNYFYTPLPDRH